MKNTFVYVLIKSDSSSFKIGLTTNLYQTIYEDHNDWKFRKDRSFVFSGDYDQMKNLENLFVSMLYNFKIDFIAQNNFFKNLFNIKGLPLLNEFVENFKQYKIRTKKISLRIALTGCKPYVKLIARENKKSLLFDIHSLTKDELEYKYNLEYNKIENIYRKFLTEMYQPHNEMYKIYLKMYKDMFGLKKDLLKVI